MDITHNNINNEIREMENIVSKGQLFAKRNKDRKIRVILRQMRRENETLPAFKDVCFYFKAWLKGKLFNRGYKTLKA